MSDELTIFDERELLGQSFRMFGTVEEPLFLAKDVAEWIEYAGRTGQLLSNVDEDEKLTHTLYASGQRREMWFLTEDGLYEVLMQSNKPIAKKFKKEVKIILKTIRKTGGYISNTDQMVNTYFGALPEEQKTLVKSLFTNIEEQQKKLQHKDKVIKGFVDDVDVAELRQILNRVVRHSGKHNIQNRWVELYKQFEMKYHCNLKLRLEKYNRENKPKLKNKLAYIDEVMNQVPDLYKIACKLYENDVKELVNEIYELNEAN